MPVRTNGMPRPRQYAPVRMAPRPALACVNARPWTAASVGPRHGVQPRPKTSPSSGAPASPVGQPVDPDVALEPRHEAEERQSHHDGHGAEDAFDGNAMTGEQAAETTEEQPLADE